MNVISLSVSELNVSSQLLVDFTVLGVLNSSDPTTITAAEKTAKVTLTGIRFETNRLVSTIPSTSSTSLVNPLISLSFVPTVLISNLVCSENYSNSLRLSGILHTQAISNLVVANSQFTLNKNLFFMFTNATYADEDEVAAAAAAMARGEETSLSKFYVLRKTKTTLDTVDITFNRL